MSPICGGTLIYAALHADTPNLLRVPLDGGLDPNWRPSGDTPMNFEVADHKLQPQLKLLIEHETNRFPRFAPGDGHLRCDIASAGEPVDYLLARGACPNGRDERGCPTATAQASG